MLHIQNHIEWNHLDIHTVGTLKVCITRGVTLSIINKLTYIHFEFVKQHKNEIFLDHKLQNIYGIVYENFEMFYQAV